VLLLAMLALLLLLSGEIMDKTARFRRTLVGIRSKLNAFNLSLQRSIRSGEEVGDGQVGAFQSEILDSHLSQVGVGVLPEHRVCNASTELLQKRQLAESLETIWKANMRSFSSSFDLRQEYKRFLRLRRLKRRHPQLV
jgi:hypothetical protein